MRKNLQAKGVLSVVLCQALLTMTLAGCGETGSAKSTEIPKTSQSNVESSKKDSETLEPVKLEPVKLVVYLNQATGTGDKQVQDAVNDLKAMKDINTQVEFVTYPQGDKFSEKVTLALSSGEQVDIVSGELDQYRDRVNAGAYADITELLDTKYTRLRDALLEDHWKAAAVNGKVYGVPTFKETANDMGFYIASSFVKDKGIDLNKTRELKDIEDILQMLKEDGRATIMVTYNNINNLDKIIFYHSYMSMISNDSVAVCYKEPTKVVSYYESEEFRNLCFMTKEWYQKGFIASDILTKENFSTEEADERKFGLRVSNHSPLGEAAYSASRGFDCSYLQLSPTTSTLTSPGFVSCINAQSKNIDRALNFLEVWNTQPEVTNTITYGVEGVNYDLVDGQVDWGNYPDHNEVWRADAARLGNMMLLYTTAGSPKNRWEIYLEAGKKARQIPHIGFVLDTSKINNEILALTTIVREYRRMLCSGTVEDVEGTLKEFIDKLKSSGLQTVIDESQKQLDAFYANKKK